MIIIYKFNPSFFLLLTITSLLFLHGCGRQDNEAKVETAEPVKELTREENFAQAKKDAEAGIAEAQVKLGKMYFKGEGVPTNTTEAVAWLEKAAKKGNANAQHVLGEIYYNDTFGYERADVRTDKTKAAEWYQKAAEQGLADAQLKLGGMYFNGEGVLKDVTKTVEWWQKAAEQGYVNAQRNLGVMYDEGLGVPKDTSKAVKWFQKAAAQGDAEAQYHLGSIFRNENPFGDQHVGAVVLKDNVKAAEWYQKAAEQGYAKAQYNLGAMYHNGNGLPKDFSKAVEWYRKAAVQGLAEAQGALGALHYLGQGIPFDPVRAYAWLNLASARGYSAAKELRNGVEKEMTRTQVAEGQRLASNWKKGDTLQAAGTSVPGNVENAGALSKHGSGTAFIVSREEHALTNHHVIDACAEVRVAGREGVAKVITSDTVNDLALLQFPGKSIGMASLNPDPANLRQGEDVIVFGYPLNSILSSGGNLTPGTLSALTGLGNNTNQIQITAPIQPGSSGSPVLDKKGNVIGVVSMKLDDGVAAKATGQIPQNVNFAVNGQTTKAFLDANKVPYKTGGGLFSREKNNADIAEDAKKWTMLVECWN